MPKILIPNAYTWYHKGDASIVIGMASALRKYMPDADITILSSTPEVDREHYGRYNLKVLRNLLTLPASDNSPRLIKAAKLLFKAAKYSLWPRIKIPLTLEEKRILSAYADADIVLSCGGGYLGGHNMPSSLAAVYGIYFAKLLGKRTIIYGQSIEHFGNVLISNATKFVLNRVDLITVREEVSLNYLKSLGIKPRLILTADAAFLVRSITTEESLKLLAKEGIYQNHRPLVGMTFRNWNFPEHSHSKARFTNYLEVMTRTVDFLTLSLGATVLLLSMSTFFRDDDRILSNEIASRAKDKTNIRVLTKDYSPEQLKGIIGQMDLFIGTRMHSNIFALSMGVPTIAISCQWKTDGIMKMLDMADYVLDMADLRFDDIVSAINKAWDNRSDIKQQLKTKIPEIENLALHNAELVKTLLD